MLDQDLGGARIKRVALGGITAFAIFIASAGVTACSQLLIARLVGADTYGVYTYVIAWMTILAYFSALGFDIALLRFLPAYQTKAAWSLARGVIQYAERRALAVGFLLILAGASIILIWSRQFTPELRNTFLIGFILVPAWALLWIRCSIVRAFGGVVLALAPDKIVRDGLLLVLVVLVSLGLGWHIDAPLIMMATLVGSTVALGLASVAMRRLSPGLVTHSPPEYTAAIWRHTAVPLMIIAAAEALLNRTGVVLLGWFGETKEAGIYSLVFNISFLVVLPRTAINTLFAPTISSLFTQNDRATLQALLTKSASWTLCAAGCIAITIAVLAEPILTWFGKDFADGVPALRILLVGQVIAASYGSQLHVMTMTEHERGAAALLILSAAVNVVASIVFIRILGLTGAAIATTIALIVWNVAMAFFISRHLRLLPGVLGMLGSARRRSLGLRP
ncbi:MAG: exopolysaccharide biosynthesis protein [Bradyrhizobium sp.]|jgi:O-antigen/teichoic acid export membrane protein|uniref:oligosaccharide flippase family protein n=1 Tax=Bradyrhizobium sp. TaxID=376 RepID=UPI001225E0AF|nr:polysaccharide biosynthesis C-terminal domain-containing protein [Bradyrhizobium sp.]THD45000.1 MAG: exopolysaccharide biosynthesis protein [Bradyrhizobium sp.]